MSMTQRILLVCELALFGGAAVQQLMDMEMWLSIVIGVVAGALIGAFSGYMLLYKRARA